MKKCRVVLLLMFLAIKIVPVQAKPSEAEPVRLRLNLQPKIEYSMRLVADQKVAVVSKNKQETLTQTATQDWIYDVREVRADGTVLLGCKITAIAFEQQRPDGNMNWNSRDDKPAPAAIDHLEALIGARFTLELESNGRIRRVLGLDEMTERILAMSKLSEESLRSMRRLFRNNVDDNTFKNIGNLMASFPDVALQIGDVWQKLDAISGDAAADYDTVCTLISRENGLATIGVRSTVKARRAQKVQPFFKGATQSGQIVVDEKTGWTQSSQVVLRNTIQSPQGRIYVLSEMKMTTQ